MLDLRQLLLLGTLSLLAASAVQAAPDYSNYAKARKQVKEIRDRCRSTFVCVNKAVELSQTETESLKILEDVIVRQKSDSLVGIRGVCFSVVVENKMEGDLTLYGSSEKLQLAAYITYNLFEAKRQASSECSKIIVIFYSRRDATLYTFASEKLMTPVQIRTASSASRPYFSNSILEGMRFLVQAYADTIAGAKS